jgi:hypothetical protein
VNFAYSDFVAFAGIHRAICKHFRHASRIRFSGRDTCNHRARGFHEEGGLAPDEAEKRISDDAYHHHLDLGGIGNPYSTIAGGIIIGMSQELSTAALPTEYKFAVSFVVMTLVLLLKPEGIF